MHDLPPATTEGGDPDSAQQLLQSLRRQIQHCESLHHATGDGGISSGCEALDRVLPHGGFRTGGLIEWLSPGPGSGAATWALRVASQAMQAEEHHGQRVLVVIDRQRCFYPPMAAAMGIDLQKLLVIQPRSHSDTMWALDQTLRQPNVAAVWTRIPRLDPRDFRRLQLAAEQGGTLGLLQRPLTARGQPSWSDVQLLVQPLPSVPWESGSKVKPRRGWEDAAAATLRKSPVMVTRGSSRGSPLHCRTPWARRWRIELLRCRGTTPIQPLYVVMDPVTGQLVCTEAPSIPLSSADAADHERSRFEQQTNQTGSQATAVHLAAQLARPAIPRRSARA